MTREALAPPLGPPLTAAEIRSRLLPRRSVKWIHRHCPRHELSPGVIVFYEQEVQDWIASKLNIVTQGAA